MGAELKRTAPFTVDMNKRLIYWICQIGGWGLHTAFFTAMIVIFGGTDSLTHGTIVLQFIIFTLLLLFSHLFRLYIHKKDWLSLKVGQLIPRAILGTLVVAIIVQALIHLIIYVVVPLHDITPFSWSALIGYIFNVFIVLILWSAIYFFIKFTEKNRQNEVEKLELRSALQGAELMILKNQINPHFLFNALNNIRALILSDQQKARKMITHISDLLRYSIQFNASEKVSLSEEMEIVKDYLQLESIQFNDRLAYDFEIAEETAELKIPPMAIQLLVENAIKHGLSISKHGGAIKIKSSRAGDNLLIDVTNTGQLGSKKRREGIGLQNLVERLKILFGPFAEFKLENSSPETVTASLKIPIS